MAPQILTIKQSLELAYDEAFFTQSATAADPDAAKFSSSFESFLSKQWQPVMDKERALRRDTLSALALCWGVDRRLDGWTDRFHNALLISTSNRRNATDYARYFGDESPSVVKRPVLGNQLKKLTSWVVSIKGASVPQLATLGTELEGLVAEGHKAEQAVRDARAKTKDFRALGERKALFDKLNSLRQSTYGALATLVHDHPEKHLPTGWADSFFRHKRFDRMTPTVEKTAIVEQLAALRTETADKERRLAELLTAEQLAVEQAAQRVVAAAKLQEVQARARATDREAQALRAELSSRTRRRRFRVKG